MLLYGKLNITSVFNHFRYLKTERNADVLSVFFECLSNIGNFINNNKELQQKFKVNLYKYQGIYFKLYTSDY